MVAPGQGFTHRFLLALKFLSGYEHRSTLPQSRIRSTAPSEREPGMGAYRLTYRPENGRLRAIFIAPTELRGGDISPFNGGHSLLSGGGFCATVGCTYNKLTEAYTMEHGGRKITKIARESFLEALDVLYRRSKAESRSGFPHLRGILGETANEKA